MRTWSFNNREIKTDPEAMEFSSSSPWKESELTALRSIPAIREVGLSHDRNRITVAPAYPSTKDTAIFAVLAVIKITEEGLCQ